MKHGKWLGVFTMAALAVGAALMLQTYLLDRIDGWLLSAAFVEHAVALLPQ